MLFSLSLKLKETFPPPLSIAFPVLFCSIKIPVHLDAGPCHLACSFSPHFSGLHFPLSGLSPHLVVPHLLGSEDWQLWMATTPGGWENLGEL